MGINGLLPLLKSIQKPTHLKSFAGHVVGIDAYVWLHRGASSCAQNIASGEPTTKYVDYCMKKAQMLVHFGITPYFVFDGGCLPSKAETETDRASRRKEAKAMADALMKAGKQAEAYKEFMKAVNITPDMAAQLIAKLQRANFQFVVAPFEADSQLVYLEKKGIISAILSEDSDLLVLGAKCLLTKMDQYGACVMIRRQDFTACRTVSLVGWTDVEFRRMAILSGCDYLKNPSNMGIKTAYSYVRKYKEIDRILNAIRFDGKIRLPENYQVDFVQAERTFLYHRVYCPVSKSMVHLNEIPADVSILEMPYLGECMDKETARGIAEGRLNPETKIPWRRLPTQPRDTSFRDPIREDYVASGSEDLKRGITIESFFRKRMPLQELDPNNMRPITSEQRLLERQQEYIAARRNAAPARRTVSETISGSVSTSHPVKRQRLCTDSVLEVPPNESVRVEYGKSRFFSSSAKDDKASLNVKKTSVKKASCDEFDPYADEAFEKAMAELDPVATYVKPQKRFSVFRDTPVTPAYLPRESPDADTSQMTVMTNMTTDSQAPSEALTPATSVGSSPAPFEEDSSIFSDALSQRAKELRKFSYNSPMPSQHSDSPSFEHMHRRKLTTKFSRTASAPVGIDSLSLPPLTFISKKPPLATSTSAPRDSQRRAPNNPLSDLIKHHEKQLPRAQPESQELLNDADWQTMEAAVVVPRSDRDVSRSPIPVTPPRAAERVKVAALAGSEDLLVPDSEGDSPETDGEHVAKFTTIDVSRFAFTGR